MSDDKNKNEKNFNYFSNTETDGKAGGNETGAGDGSLYLIIIYAAVVLFIVWFIFF